MLISKAGVVCAVSLLFAGVVSAQQEDYSTWAANKSLALNTSATGANITTSQINFPVLVRLTSANSAEVFSGSLSAGGADVRFAKADGTPLSYELSKWDATGKKAFFWVLMDTVKAASTTQTIKMYWGKSGVASKSDSSKVFAPSYGYAAVLHLNKSYSGGAGTSNFTDATGQGNAGWTNGTTDTSAPIDRGRYFQCSGGSSDATAGDSVVINGFLGQPSVVTLSTWVKVDSVDQAPDQYSGSGHRAVIMGIGDNVSISDGGNLESGATDSLWGAFYSNGGSVTWNNFGYTAPNGNTMWHKGWMHAALVANTGSGYMKLFLNGDSVATYASTDPITYSAGTNVVLGKHAANQYGQKLGGALCEARFDNVERSRDWLRLCYMNQRADDKLLGLGLVTAVAPRRAESASKTMADFAVKGAAITYSLKSPGVVQLSMHDARGRTVWALQEMHAAGNYEVKLNHTHLAAGSYIVQFKTAGLEKQSVIVLSR